MAVELEAKVTPLGTYPKGSLLEDLEIVVLRKDWDRVPFPIDSRIPLELDIDGCKGRGWFLYQNRNKPYISQKFSGIDGTKNLAEALAKAKLPGKAMVRLLIEGQAVTVTAMDDVLRRTRSLTPPTPTATDAPPPRIETTTYRILRDTEVARRVKVLRNHKCQLCGSTIVMPDGTRYAEAHHIHPLGADEPGLDIVENIICVCPNHHAELDLGLWDISIEKLTKVSGHTVGKQHVAFHNEVIRKRWNS